MSSSEQQKVFRRALGQFPTGVCIVTTQVGGERLGMTMSSFNSLSLDPPLVLFSIDKRAKGLPQWEQAQAYAIHVLAQEQKELSNRFAKGGGDKWIGIDAASGLDGVPVLHGMAAVFECSAYQRHDAGDHVLFLAQVEHFTANNDRLPLLFAGGRYASIHRELGEAPLWPLAIHY